MPTPPPSDAAPLPESGPTGPIPEANRVGHHPPVEQDKPSSPPRRRPRVRRGRGRSADQRPGRVIQPDGQGTSPGDKGTDRDTDGRGARSQRFPFAFEPRLAPLSAVFGVTPLTAHVDVGSDELIVRFGWWLLRTPLNNVASAEATGPFDVVRVAGPARLSLRDRGVTFATSTTGGVCIRFHRPVAAALPLGLLRHPAATVTVQSGDQLLALLQEQTGGANS